MEMHLYWISALTYAVVLGIILFSDKRESKKSTNLEKSYQLMMAWVVFFCIQDALWGLCESKVIKSDVVFFISSSIFHMSTVITTYFWLKYALVYLGDKVKRPKLYLLLDILIICFEAVLVVVNCFSTTLFEIVDGNYITGYLRPLTFINQYIVYVIIGIITLTFALKKRTRVFAHYRTVFFFSLAPILLGFFQLMFPEAPFYSLGYFLGCFIIHIFVVENDREIYLSNEDKIQKIIDLNNKLEAKQTEIDEQFDILKSISGMFEYINLVDFDSHTASRFDIKNSQEESFDIVNDAHTSLNKRIANWIDESDYDRFWEYTDLSTLNDRIKGKKLISAEFKYTEGDWIRAMYIRIGDNVNESLGRVAYALRNITSDRKREEQVYSAMTNLVYSLHVFDLENDTMERLIESDILKQIIGNEESAQCMSNIVMRATCKDEYLDIMLEFVDLSTVSSRMKGKKSLTCEFVGKYHGWTRMTFVPIEMNNSQVKKLVVMTQIIDSEKNEIINLVYKSSTDELTRLYNRRMYDEELELIKERNDLNDLIIVAMDVNGLKTVNDNLGHKAGDELIIGASKCIEKSFSSVGKAYRTGGDEFMAIIRCDERTLSDVLLKFDQNIEDWRGNMLDSLSISYGYVAAADYPKLSVGDLVSEADKRMYEAKAAYYRKMGINRRRT